MKIYNLITVFSLLYLTSCSINSYYDSLKPHHTENGFKNIYYDDKSKGIWDYWKWRWQRLFEDIPDVDDYDFKRAINNPELLKNNHDKTSLTWIGHATFLIQHVGLNILTDPQFSHRASPVSWAGPQRVVPPGISINDLPEIDVIIISHDHYDSLDVESLKKLSMHNKLRTLMFLVPLGMKSWLDELELENINVVELDWGQSYIVGEVTFTAAPVQHWSKRTLFDAFDRLWVSWIIEGDNNKIYFVGDSGYTRHFKEIGKLYGPFDLALIPIGAYEPRWFMKGYHVNPEESVKIHLDIQSKYSVAMHWGTFILTDEPLDEPPKKLKQALENFNVSESNFEVYRHGETRFFDLSVD
ncbi:MAG: MBL fold metallo-hydrolase [Gammaproteobacteria bacterium]|nr:MBL fold metallo-hydrolase [Gammaproteobacteria bacterium]